MNINEYVEMFNKDIENVPAHEEKENLLYMARSILEKKYDVGYYNFNCFSIPFDFMKTSKEGYDFKCHLELIFKFQVERTDQKVPYGKRYLCKKHLKSIRFVESKLSFCFMTFRFHEDGRLYPNEWFGISPFKVKMKKDRDVKEFINELQIHDYNSSMHGPICEPFIRKCMQDKTFAETHNFDRFVIDRKQFKFDLDNMYNYVMKNFLTNKTLVS